MRTRSGRALAVWALVLAACAAIPLVAAASARAFLPATIARVPLPYAGPGAGGWSGIDVSPDGTRFWTVTDQGKHSEGTLERGSDGRLRGIAASAPVFLPGLDGPRIGEYPDSEAIDVDAEGGRTVVGFEGFTRLRSYDRAWTRAHWLPDPPDARLYHYNRGFEAVARDALGRIYAIPERPLDRGAPFPLLRFTKREWMAQGDWTVATRLANTPGWLIVGADFAPDGALFVLERRFLGIGFSSRIRRFDIGQAVPTDTLEGEEVYRSPLGRHGNLEGIGLWQDHDGHLRAVLVSDDNLRSFQRAEIVEVVLGPAAEPAR